MKKIAVILACFMLLLNIMTISKATEKSDVYAEGAVLMEMSTKRVMYQKNAHLELPMASTTKIMTALVALSYGKLSETVIVPDEAQGVEGSSIWLSAGEKHTLEDLLYGLMLSSGNDAAVTIAIHIGGSVEGFSAMMNQKARDLGANDSNFVNPHGLHDEEHFTTAYDLALIAATAMENEDFRTIVSTESRTIPWEGAQWDRTLQNKNKILWQYEGGNGVKTGYTSNAGRCLVAAANREDMQLISVVLDSPDMFLQSQSLLDYGFDVYDMHMIFNKDEYLGEVEIKGGTKDKVEFYGDENVYIPVTEEEKSLITKTIRLEESINAPVEEGMAVGEIDIFIDNNLIASTQLYTKENVVSNSLMYNINKVIENWL